MGFANEFGMGAAWIQICGPYGTFLGQHGPHVGHPSGTHLMHCNQTNACVAVLGTHIILYNIYCRMSCNSIYIYYDYETAGVVYVTYVVSLWNGLFQFNTVFTLPTHRCICFESITNLQRFDFLKIFVSPGGMRPPKKIRRGDCSATLPNRSGRYQGTTPTTWLNFYTPCKWQLQNAWPVSPTTDGGPICPHVSAPGSASRRRPPSAFEARSMASSSDCKQNMQHWWTRSFWF